MQGKLDFRGVAGLAEPGGDASAPVVDGAATEHVLGHDGLLVGRLVVGFSGMWGTPVVQTTKAAAWGDRFSRTSAAFSAGLAGGPGHAAKLEWPA
ncbi:hypothetical protein C882_1041 [Caenispirillum salinarum AK4]|uniref:Uncharacterized protein n=1 Tax=Caenispirillum salinarum AK4 TaxID=1238182 RepID=K9GQ00_9PROT|nr:hypothetical protein C882_1041 [Caenispirillum salinarum AK4]